MDRLFLFEKAKLDAVSAEATLRGHKFDGRHCHLSGKGIDDMTPEEKFEAGKKGVGGSSIPELMGEGFHGPNGLVNEFDKKFFKKPLPVKPSKQRMFDQGHFSETMIFEMVSGMLPEGWKLILDKNRYTDNEKNYMFCDFDGILVSPDGEEFPLEIKSYNDFPGREKPVSGVYGEGGKLPHDGYKWQIRYYMHELNARAAVCAALPVGAYEESEMALTVIYRDFDKEDEMLEGIDDFWLNHVKKGIRPGFTTLDLESSNSKDAEVYEGLKESGAFSPNYKKGKIINFENADDELKEEIKQFLEKKAEYKEANEKRNAAKARYEALQAGILSSMADAETAQIEIDKKVFTITRSKKPDLKSVDTTKLKKQYPDFYQEILELCSKTTEYKDAIEITENK